MSLLESGSILEGKYEILDRLAAGGMGEVYRVRHVHLQELRVIKILRPDLAGDRDAAERFHREARLATQIKHSNVATLHDYSRLSSGSFYMVWENIDGENVAHWIKHRGPFRLMLALDLGIQALRGLEAIHAAHVIHRDISPDNLMITRDVRDRLQVKIIDLGLAKSLTDRGGFQSGVGRFGGKIHYCSPEQAGIPKGVTLDHRSDLYSFALVLYEMICGLPPFELDNRPGSIWKRLSQAPLPLSGRNPEVQIPQELDRVVRRALERGREKRFPDAASFIRALVAVGQKLQGRKGVQIAPRAGRLRLRSAARSSGVASGATAGSEQHDEAVGEAERAVTEGRIQEARELIDRLERSDPQILRVTELKKRVTAAVARRRHAQLLQTEQILEQYLSAGQQRLAAAALEALLELDPRHPRRGTYEQRLEDLAVDSQLRRKAERNLEAGRQKLSQGDTKGAREQLEQLQREDASGRLVETLRAAVEQAEEEQKRSTKLEEQKKKLDALLRKGRLDRVEAELAKLAVLGVPKVTVDLYRNRLSDLRLELEKDSKVEMIENRYQEMLRRGFWERARELALDLEKTLHDSPRPAEMFAEISRREELARRRQAIEEGRGAVERYLRQGKSTEAGLALKILLQLNPDDPERGEYERRLQALRKGRSAGSLP